MKYKAVRGMEDILPGDIDIWQYLERQARADLEFYGYTEIRTPILEDTSIFTRSIGEATDIVKKEMYTFRDKKGRSLTLRPEGTAPIVRSYVEHSLDKISPVSKLYYIGPMFRSERPQKGRSRQFHQIGVEVIGAKSHFADAEVVTQLSKMLESFGLGGFTIKINNLGCKKDKETYARKLEKYLESEKNRLCADCRERIKKNVLRVMDCKNETCIQVAREAPDILESLCTPCKTDYGKLKKVLKDLKVKFKETKNLVRGLDYYTGTVFEVTHPALGAQDAIGAGGRYDNLVKDLGGPDTPAIGYALGIERIILALKKDIQSSKSPLALVYVATLGDAAKIRGIQLVREMRDRIQAIILTDVKEASLKSQMRAADKNNAKIAVIIGENELKSGEVIIRDMKAKKQVPVKKGNIIAEIEKLLKG